MKNRIEAQVKTIWNRPLCIAASLFISLSSTAMAASTATTAITNSGFAFPATVTINVGDTLSFTLGSTIHNAVEVSQTTYNANGATALAGGFSVPDGGSAVKVSGLTQGTHYYVCTHHAASSSMKGQIIVQAPNAVNPSLKELSAFTFQIEGLNSIPMIMLGKGAKISIMDIKGRLVWAAVIGKNDAQSAYWDRKVTGGGKAATGTYFVELTALDAEQKSTDLISRTVVQLH